jgi:hypothetical protein
MKDAAVTVLTSWGFEFKSAAMYSPSGGLIEVGELLLQQLPGDLGHQPRTVT